MFLLDCYRRCRTERRIGRLTKEKRDEILKKSPYQAEFFQGEGYHVFLKSDPDYYTGYVASIGEVSPEAAENWIIKTYWKEND